MFANVFLLLSMICATAYAFEGQLPVNPGGHWRTIGQGCAQARDNKPAHLTYNDEPVFVRALRLTHTHGKVGCTKTTFTNWGCSNRHRTNMYVTDEYNAVMYPSPVLVKPFQKGGWYNLPGYGPNSKELVFEDVGSRYLYRGQKIRVWYGEDLYGYTESDNQGKTCFKVDVFVIDVA